MARSHWLSAGTLVVGFVLVVTPSVLSLAPAAESPGRLRYGFKPDQTVAYRIEITADRDDATETFQGVICFKCRSAEKDLLELTYSGGLNRTSNAKPSQSFSRFGPPRFGPRMFGPSRAFGPFSETPFKGLIVTTNDLTVTCLGEVQSMRGNSQLPYLLGNASLLIFEPLPAEAKESWSMTTGISITEEGGRQGFPYRLPFDRESSKQTTSGSEVLTFRVQSVDGPRVFIDKTYRLDSPAVNKEVSGFQVNGTGTWVFNREQGIPESLELEQRLVFQKGNTTTTVPMSVRYFHMSEAEFEAHQEKQKQLEEEGRKRIAERQEKEANTPLTEEEIRKALENLHSDNMGNIILALQNLQKKNPKMSDPRLAMAIDTLKGHENALIRQNAEKAAQKWPLPPVALPVSARKRTWSDSSGTFTVEAEFVALTGDKVCLRRSDGKEIEVALDHLSVADQEVAQELAKAPSVPNIDNPFD